MNGSLSVRPGPWTYLPTFTAWIPCLSKPATYILHGLDIWRHESSTLLLFNTGAYISLVFQGVGGNEVEPLLRPSLPTRALLLASLIPPTF